ncbi:unnamed protein product, partial [Mesorhabditis belari]|uniref:Uncharacterized protein n=1 Tax=Mesorhabditis belari TaxID=2138241 RepID=A0AAF3JAS2_9BILA
MTGKITDAASRHEEGLLENAMLTDSVEDRTNYMKEPQPIRKASPLRTAETMMSQSHWRETLEEGTTQNGSGPNSTTVKDGL